MTSKLNTTCRVCLSEDQSGVSIFEKQDDTKYSDLIQEYTGLNLIEHDILPYIICDNCKVELNNVIKFINKCRQSNKKLQELIFYNVPVFYLQRNIKDENPNEKIKRNSENSIKEEFDHADGEEVSESFADHQETSNDSDVFSRQIICEKSNLLKLQAKDLKVEFGTRKKTIGSENANRIKYIKSEKTKLICSECGKKYLNKWALETHMRKHTGERPFSCPECSKTFTQNGTLAEHIKRFHTDQQSESERKRFACDLCDKRFLKKSILMVHMRVHTKEKPFKCTYCESRFTQLGILSQHEKIHTGEKPHACHLCAKRFITGSCLKRHLRTHEVDRCFKCHICDKTLKTKLAIQEHIMSKHTLEKPFVCDKCGMGFMRKTCLKLHVKAKHSELFGYCNQCNRGYSNLPRHMRVHNGERPFECEICRQTFTIKQRLSVHLALHRNSSKFVCPHDKCAAAYSSQCKLDSHVLKFHNKNFAHVCDFCSKGFCRAADLTKHLNFCKKQNLPSIK